MGPEREAALNAVETNFHVPADQVEMTITAGRDALKTNKVFNAFLTSLRAAPRRGVAIGTPAPESSRQAQTQ